jgi:proteasome lid subunit RPN8/RPN11
MNNQCPVCTDLDISKCEIKIGTVVWGYIQAMMYEMKSNEFAVYLLGSINEDGQKFIIDDYYVPKQEVNPIKVDVKEEIYTIPKEIRERIIGYLHSHHSMGYSSSGTDREHLNHPLHIIIAHQGYEATIRKRVGCGKWLAISGVPITFYADYVEPTEIEKIEVTQSVFPSEVLYQTRLDEDGNYFDPIKEKYNFEEYQQYLEKEDDSQTTQLADIDQEAKDGMEI